MPPRPARDAEFDALILQAERRAERGIAVLRILTAVALAIVFGFSVLKQPIPDNPDVLVQIVLARLTMFAYALLGFVALFLTSPHRFRRWYSYAFVTADALFVAISVHLALLNHGVSGHYMPAMPSVWLVPLVLSFNALRLSWTVQALAGLVMVVALSLVAARSGAGRDGVIPQAIYPSFGEPANVMRIAMVALACIVLTVAVVRTRRLLRGRIDQARRRALLTSYLPRQVARLIEETDNAALRAGQIYTVAVMFVDVRNFTARSETMEPAQVSAFLSDFRRILREAVEAAGGTVDKFIGDGAMAVFGPMKRNGDCARTTLTCAREIIARVEAWSDALVEEGRRPVRVGIGIHMGEAFVGAVGDEERLEFTVVGDVVNTAARMEEAAKLADADIVVSDEVLDTADMREACYVPLTRTSVRGRCAAVPASSFTSKLKS
ncbi:MAG: adenylate/guanylate cyclase domain-containing protein [Acuticoccus sp.]